MPGRKPQICALAGVSSCSMTWRISKYSCNSSSASCSSAPVSVVSVTRCESTLAIGKQQLRVAVCLPESAQHAKGGLGQGNKPVPIAFGIAHMDPVAGTVNVAHLQGQPITQTQAHAVHGEIEHPVAQCAGAEKRACASSTVTMSGRRCTLGGLMKFGIAHGLPSTCRV